MCPAVAEPNVQTVPWWSQFPARAAIGALPYVPRIPLTRLEWLFPRIGDLEVTVRHETEDRALTHGEALVLSLVTAYVKPRRILEIGTASGQAVVLMARQAPEATIDTIDLGNETPSLGQQRGQPPWQDLSTVGAAYRDAGLDERVTQHFADSARFDWAPFKDSIDLMLIDGGHTYEYVLSDSRAAVQVVRSGGVIVWDDCNYVSPGVGKALAKLRREDGVPVYRIFGTRLAIARLP